MQAKTALIPFRGRKIWCAVVGEAAARGRLPVICVPGGPGMPHDYLGPMAQLARRGRQVVFYDAMGSGRSERPPEEPWTLEVYIEEMKAVAAALGMRRYHLFVHSAAGLMGIPHALAHPPELASLVLAGTPVNMPEHTEHMRGQLMAMGVTGEHLEAFERAEKDPALRTAKYMKLVYDWFGRNMCRVRPLPEPLARGAAGANARSWQAMKGGSLLYCTALKDWDMTDRVGEIEVPVLFTIGGADILRREGVEDAVRRMPRGELAVFEHSTHMPHFEEPELYLDRVARFLEAHDDGPGGGEQRT